MFKARLKRRKLMLLRGERRWTQTEAANAAGVSLSTYCSAEAGRELNILKAQAIADVFAVKLEDLEETENTMTVPEE